MLYLKQFYNGSMKEAILQYAHCLFFSYILKALKTVQKGMFVDFDHQILLCRCFRYI